jgi:hypothetical protein
MDLPYTPSYSLAKKPLGELMAMLGAGNELDWHPSHLAVSAWLEHVPFAFWIIKALTLRR